MAEALIDIEVVYAAVNRQQLLAVKVPIGTTLRHAVELSKIIDLFPEDGLLECAMGIFGRRIAAPENYILEAGDRVEIYRALVADPMEVRRMRAAKAAKPSKKRG